MGIWNCYRLNCEASNGRCVMAPEAHLSCVKGFVTGHKLTVFMSQARGRFHHSILHASLLHWTLGALPGLVARFPAGKGALVGRACRAGC